MAVTRSTAADRPQLRRARQSWRRNELLGVLAAGVVVAFGLHLVYRAKSPALLEIEQGLAARRLHGLCVQKTCETIYKGTA